MQCLVSFKLTRNGKFNFTCSGFTQVRSTAYSLNVDMEFKLLIQIQKLILTSCLRLRFFLGCLPAPDLLYLAEHAEKLFHEQHLSLNSAKNSGACLNFITLFRLKSFLNMGPGYQVYSNSNVVQFFILLFIPLLMQVCHLEKF